MQNTPAAARLFVSAATISPSLLHADSHPSRGVKARNLQDWIQTAGVLIPTPAAKDLQVLVDAAADNRRLRKQLEALREAELELAAREAEETAHTFSMLVVAPLLACNS